MTTAVQIAAPSKTPADLTSSTCSPSAAFETFTKSVGLISPLHRFSAVQMNGVGKFEKPLRQLAPPLCSKTASPDPSPIEPTVGEAPPLVKDEGTKENNTAAESEAHQDSEEEQPKGPNLKVPCAHSDASGAQTAREQIKAKLPVDTVLSSLLGSGSDSWAYSDTALEEALRLRAEQERTKQEFFRLESRKRTLDILHLALRAKIPGPLIPLLFMDNNQTRMPPAPIVPNSSVQLMQAAQVQAAQLQAQAQAQVHAQAQAHAHAQAQAHAQTQAQSQALAQSQNHSISQAQSHAQSQGQAVPGQNYSQAQTQQAPSQVQIHSQTKEEVSSYVQTPSRNQEHQTQLTAISQIQPGQPQSGIQVVLAPQAVPTSAPVKRPPPSDYSYDDSSPIRRVRHAYTASTSAVPSQTFGRPTTRLHYAWQHPAPSLQFKHWKPRPQEDGSQEGISTAAPSPQQTLPVGDMASVPRTQSGSPLRASPRPTAAGQRRLRMGHMRHRSEAAVSLPRTDVRYILDGDNKGANAGSTPSTPRAMPAQISAPISAVPIQDGSQNAQSLSSLSSAAAATQPVGGAPGPLVNTNVTAAAVAAAMAQAAAAADMAMNNQGQR